MANYYSKKQIEKAREIDVLTYLQTYEPTELVQITVEIIPCDVMKQIYFICSKHLSFARRFSCLPYPENTFLPLDHK